MYMTEPDLTLGGELKCQHGFLYSGKYFKGDEREFC